MSEYEDPDYETKVELTLAEAEMRKSIIGSLHYSLCLSLTQC